MKMRDPNGVQVRPIEAQRSHSRRDRGRAIEKKIAAARLEPEARAGARWVRHRRARADDREFHIVMID